MIEFYNLLDNKNKKDFDNNSIKDNIKLIKALK